jgi:hypothetical protein
MCQFISFIVRNNTISEAQNGFREKQSTDTAITLFSKVYRVIKKRATPFGIFFCLTKTYDVMNHGILLARLKSYNASGIADSCLNQIYKISEAIYLNKPQCKHKLML